VNALGSSARPKPMLVNRVVETARALQRKNRVLRRRARSSRTRVPLVLVPSLMGTRLVDPRGRGVWSSKRQLYFPLSSLGTEARTAGLLEGFTLLPGLWSYDVYGGLVRYLERIGGYARGEDLFVLDYDWRTGIAEASAELGAFVRRLEARIGERKIDLLGISSGGLVARHFLGSNRERARRCVSVGTPQRGSFTALEALTSGLRLAPLGRLFSSREVAGLQTIWDCLPHPAERTFIDEQGNLLDLDLYDADVWRRFGFASLGRDAIAARLDHARASHEALDRCAPHPDLFVVGGRKIPTAIRACVSGDRVAFPACAPAPNDPLAALMFSPGDSSTSEASLCGVPGLSADRVRWVSPKEHRLLTSAPDVHHRILEALLAESS
jgi:pimeloyl-ACP methyl ester carboxylesterase